MRVSHWRVSLVYVVSALPIYFCGKTVQPNSMKLRILIERPRYSGGRDRFQNPRTTGFRDKEVFDVFSEVLNFYKKIVAIWDFLISTIRCAYLWAFECKKRIWNISDSFFYKNPRMWEKRLKSRIFYFRAQFWPTFQKQVIFSLKRVIRSLTSPFEWAMKFWFLLVGNIF